MNIEQKRGEVLKAYSGEKWKSKVLAMSDGQVLAVYQNIFLKPRTKKEHWQ